MTTSSRYTVELTRDAEKDLESNRLRTYRDRVVKRLIELEADPVRGHSLRQSLKGCRSLEFSLPGGAVYRAVYVILERERVCLVFLIGPHEGIYQKAERRFDALKRSGAL